MQKCFNLPYLIEVRKNDPDKKVHPKLIMYEAVDLLADLKRYGLYDYVCKRIKIAKLLKYRETNKFMQKLCKGEIE